MMEKNKGWGIWPLVAFALATTFVVWDVSLVSRARGKQAEVARQVRLLDRLSAIKVALDELALERREEDPDLMARWPADLAEVRTRLEATTDFDATVPALEEFRERIQNDLHAADSLQKASTRSTTRPEDAHRDRAITRIVLQRSKTEVERRERRVYEDGLHADIASLNGHWTEAQLLLFAACLLAVLMAAMVGMNRKLLFRSRRHARELATAHEALERSSTELRETMLSKEEKEVMIKEIHHRVKNNLQIVRSLIRFQTDKVSDPAMLELFHECINRVGAMALVHEQTYLTKDLANIDVGAYMNNLVRDLIGAYNIRMELEQDIDIQVRTLGVDTLVPLGLLINEIISNSFKHAFKGRTKGKIMVHLRGEEGNLELYIGDDGTGLPDMRKWEQPESLGLELVHTLAGQLDSNIELVPGQGTRYVMRSIPTKASKRA